MGMQPMIGSDSMVPCRLESRTRTSSSQTGHATRGWATATGSTSPSLRTRPRACWQGAPPMECYADFMQAFRDAFVDDLGTAIEEVVVGTGPCGELRYPSYVEANGWRFPGVSTHLPSALIQLCRCHGIAISS